MATGGQKRTRSERVAALELPPGQWERAWLSLHRRDVLVRIALALAASAIMTVLIGAWDPPFAFRTGHVPLRDIVSRVAFAQDDSAATDAAKQRAASEAPFVYEQDPAPLEQLRHLLRNTVVGLTSASKLSEVKPELWRQFEIAPPPGAAESPQSREQQFQAFRAAFTGQENLQRFDAALAEALKPFEEKGLLENLPPHPDNSDSLEQGNQRIILVHPVGKAKPMDPVEIKDVLIGDGEAVHKQLEIHLQTKEIADRVFAWMRPHLKECVTLRLDKAGTDQARDELVRAVTPRSVLYQKGQTLVQAGEPLGLKEMDRLKLEYATYLSQRPNALRIGRAGAIMAVVFALMILCGIHMRYRQRGPLASVTRLAGLLTMAILAVALARLASADQWRAELVPLMLFAMIVAIVYRQELAVFLSGVLAWIATLAIGHTLAGFLLMLGTMTAAVVNLGTIRSRSKLIYVGLFAGLVAFVLDVAMNMIDNQPLDMQLVKDAARQAVWALSAGFIMTGLLPFIEQLFGVLTDLSLLELGDVTHPLLQELVRRAPSTYNHSITVGSISEAAAESIGARGLLVRVGAYFHDIGKMLKPGYFIENQGSEISRHETLVPAMSTLVIIAHIKDGSDLARQHHLPQPIIDLIAQHHGTTLVEFFYDRAHEQQHSDPNGTEVDESTFRYPGPRPQTKEAAVLMLADAVESASRTLVDPTPARIESLVRDIAERRLHGGQFDESGLTLRELRTIERSMVMSLTAIYHGRLKYPDQKTA